MSIFSYLFILICAESSMQESPLTFTGSFLYSIVLSHYLHASSLFAVDIRWQSLCLTGHAHRDPWAHGTAPHSARAHLRPSVRVAAVLISILEKVVVMRMTIVFCRMYLYTIIYLTLSFLSSCNTYINKEINNK